MGRISATIAVAWAGLALSACQDGAGPRPQWSHLSPAGQSIAIDAIEGPPPGVRSELVSELTSAAAARRVEMAGNTGSARFRLKGYLTTETTDEGGTALAFVWDVFDADKRRAKRVAGSRPIRSAASDPWGELDRDALRKLAEQSMDEIATFLASRNESAPPG